MRIFPPFILFVTLLLGGCGPRLHTQFLVAAENPRVYQHQNIALLDYSGTASHRVTRQVEQTLSAIEVRGVPYFELHRAERAEDAQQARQRGQRLGVDAVHFGRVLHYGWHDEPLSMSREQWCKRPYRGVKRNKDQLQACLYGEERPSNHPFHPHEEQVEVVIEESNSGHGKAHKSVRKITTRRTKERVTTPVICRKRTARVEILPQVVEVASGQLIYSKKQQAKRWALTCPGDQAKGSTAAETLLAQALSQSLTAYRQDIAPYLRAVTIPLLEETQGLSPRATQNLLQGVAFARDNRMPRACSLWQQSLEQSPSPNAALLYNLGVCQEVAGDLAAADQLYQQAEALLSQPNDAISRAIARVNGGLQRY
ncbi:hypothetical protein Mmc1_3178 [Magnetococcus marinus MC-1]|uniref:Uncharacterized protein n=1 Tax=Magnetococcus marinus (strain ATCC BAA-1437 / JCM 17883 / MC-1) TaxID=156889 RepID=A0LCH5_MAGMM|nr:tetratricopeptide repeat protein [Magnetococcus marinus]ABK45668.1 hypothetical protein Mmc1_3178 [Magnetococcus marinus MC-1]